jgi:hypothetical protein
MRLGLKKWIGLAFPSPKEEHSMRHRFVGALLTWAIPILIF